MDGVFRVGSDAYDDFMGRYSVLLAPLFADFAGVRGGQRVLDVGAGTGALTRELVSRGADVVAAEPSPEFTRALHARFPQIEVHEAPAEKLRWRTTHRLDDRQRTLAHDELHRQLGSPSGGFRLNGRAFAAAAGRQS